MSDLEKLSAEVAEPRRELWEAGAQISALRNLVSMLLVVLDAPNVPSRGTAAIVGALEAIEETVEETQDAAMARNLRAAGKILEQIRDQHAEIVGGDGSSA
jgi:hypothetical protein